MRAVVQRVSAASVTVEGQVVGQIGPGLLVFAAVGDGDGEPELRWLADKVVNLRIFNDASGKFDRTVQDIGGAVLAVSQFTLYGDCRKGRRPSFTAAAAPELARALFAQFVTLLRATGVPTESGVFQASMRVDAANDGPVTILLDSAKTF
ncbi:MAG: D-tyrosyl-tRNA(Tyr) deacylase [Fimbriimonadaceae bacterium]|nr:D-tyrosyl-tRNA(Tyr) deacylase [Fimbriimonadaceae bacterium]